MTTALSKLGISTVCPCTITSSNIFFRKTAASKLLLGNTYIPILPLGKNFYYINVRVYMIYYKFFYSN
jgi:hypothetical protein